MGNIFYTSIDSERLYQFCCRAGFSKEQWKLRLAKYDIQQALFKAIQTDNSDVGVRFQPQVCGSFSEGLAVPWLGSDIDVLAFSGGVSVINGTDVSADEKVTVLQMVPTSNPVIFNLCLLHIGTECSRDLFNTPKYCEADEQGRLFFNGRKLRENRNLYIDGDYRGPSVQKFALSVGLDYVVGLQCRSWPPVFDEWVHRERPFNWPSQPLIREVIKRGCELVSVPGPTSKTPDLDWRLSTSKAEKLLIWNFNTCQIMCFILLKIVLVYRIKPKLKLLLVTCPLCTYHIKTVMLHVVESSDPSMWTKDNLAICFELCLRKLLSFVETGVCPHYFISQHNLFARKVYGLNKLMLKCVLRVIVSESRGCMLGFDLFDNLLNQYQHTCQYEELCIMINECVCGLHATLLCSSQEEMLSSYSQMANAFTSCTMETGTGVDLKEILLSYFTSNIDNYADSDTGSSQVQLSGTTLTCITANLKRAFVLFVRKDLASCISTVFMSLSEYVKREALPFRYGEGKDLQYNKLFKDLTQENHTMQKLLKRVVFPVVLNNWEINACASLPRGQVFIPMGQAEDVLNYYFSPFLQIDCLVFAYFLLVVSYTKLGNETESRRYLHNLCIVVENPRIHFICFPEVALAIYNQCKLTGNNFDST